MTFPTRFTSTAEVVQVISSGSSCAILVEGEEQDSDAWVLRQITKRTVSSEVTFFGRGSRRDVLAQLPTFVSSLPERKVAAIVDRDFTSDEIVEQTYAPDYSGHLFYWRRSCIENYLLEPAWIAEFAEVLPGQVSERLATPEAVGEFLLDWSERLAPQIAGNWVISDLTSMSEQRRLMVTARAYFQELTHRDSAWVLNELTRNYGGWSETVPEYFSPSSVQALFEDKLAQAQHKIQSLDDAHQVVSGKLLLKALHQELPTAFKPRTIYIRNRLAQMASKQVPDDIHVLVEERILPRWRAARQAQV
jgi:hypothetical protein